MKFVVFALALFSLNFAFAAEVLVTEFRVPFDRNYPKAEFNINRDMGRSWVQVVTYNKPHQTRDREAIVTRAQVEGLSFDNATSLIVYNGVACAKVEVRGYGPFRYNKVTNTGCELKTKEVTKTYDNGYETYEYQAIQVYLNVL